MEQETGKRIDSQNESSPHLTEARVRELVREELKAAQPCTCQYGDHTPRWYISVKTCAKHGGSYNAGDTPEWWDASSNEYVGTQKKSRPEGRLYCAAGGETVSPFPHRRNPLVNEASIGSDVADEAPAVSLAVDVSAITQNARIPQLGLGRCARWAKQLVNLNDRIFGTDAVSVHLKPPCSRNGDKKESTPTVKSSELGTTWDGFVFDRRGVPQPRESRATNADKTYRGFCSEVLTEPLGEHRCGSASGTDASEDFGRVS